MNTGPPLQGSLQHPEAFLKHLFIAQTKQDWAPTPHTARAQVTDWGLALWPLFLAAQLGGVMAPACSWGLQGMPEAWEDLFRKEPPGTGGEVGTP